MDRKRTNILFICMAIVAIVILIGTGAYAYYQTGISGTTSGTIAKWSFKANNQTESFNIDFGKLYPGKTGIYNIELSAEDSDLDVYYEIVFHNQDFQQLVFWDSSYTETIDFCGKYGKYGTIPAGQKITIPIYFNWPYNESETFYRVVNDENTITVIGQQLNGYSGNTPMYFFEYYDYKDGYIIGSCPV